MGGLENQLFQLKFTAKQLQKQSKRCQKEEAQEKLKVKKAIEQGNNDFARIYAQTAIRKKNEALNLLQLSSRVDAAATRVQSAITLKAVSSTMASVVKNMDKSLANMDLEKIGLAMDRFETQVESLDAQEQTIMSVDTPSNEQVDALINQMMLEPQKEQANGLFAELDQLGIPSSLPTKAPKQQAPINRDSSLEQRIQALRE
ncbi:putative vacuolar-protein sorting and endocytosis factor [Hesseltinella vesiculosa]|uniref:Putative vacuolar-protein sorting and endocytosis factor n=1 Tax=Hesseltinella vesiculosa TaxID=101127 RepID=A0A1X2G9P3_9FUNG|nr:putative vacuolar-protein sorting and endocytosis factor [Hesseltinella vesiculosa]